MKNLAKGIFGILAAMSLSFGAAAFAAAFAYRSFTSRYVVHHSRWYSGSTMTSWYSGHRVVLEKPS